MGTTFSTIQIQNPNKAPQQQFKELLCKFFEAKGLVPATEEDAQFTYWLAFNEDNGWVTLGSGGYDLGEVHSDVPEIAKDLNTRCVLTSVWDSDFLEVKLFGSSPEQNDMIVAGQPYDADMVSEGNPELWKPLLVNGRTWEEVKEICDKDYTFAEGALLDLAPIFGMNPQSVTFEYNCSEEVSSEAQNVIELYLKNAVQTYDKIIDITQIRKNSQSSPAKAISLNAAFKQVFGEALAPLGFVKIKGRQPYLVRMVGDEILHIVTCLPKPDKHFEIRGGVATVYRPRLTLDENPSHNINWLKSLLDYYQRTTLYEENPKYSFRDLNEFYYNEETQYNSSGKLIKQANQHGTIIDVLTHALKLTTEIMLPLLDKVTELTSCIEFLHKYGGYMNLSYDGDEFFQKYSKNSFNEGLLYVIVDDYDIIKRRIDDHIAESRHYNKNVQKSINEVILKQKSFLSKMTSDSDYKEKVLNESNEYKINNYKLIKQYSIQYL